MIYGGYILYYIQLNKELIYEQLYIEWLNAMARAKFCIDLYGRQTRTCAIYNTIAWCYGQMY